jgi:phage/plasmid-associated DNA primase
MDKASWWGVNANMSGVLNWAIEGRRRWKANGGFTRSAASEALKGQIQHDMNTVALFIADQIVSGDGGYVSVSDLYRRYVEWCSDSGHKPLSKIKFNRAVEKLVRADGVEKKPKKEQGVTFDAWVGLRLLPGGRAVYLATLFDGADLPDYSGSDWSRPRERLYPDGYEFNGDEFDE